MDYKKMTELLGSSQEADSGGIIIKHIPEYGNSRPGAMDPRVLEDRKRLAAEAMAQESNGNPVDLETMRASMGWPNLDVTDGSILTLHRSISGEYGEIPVRIYKPDTTDLLPCMVFFHGGGFIGGTVDCVENSCKCLAWNGDCVVVSVDYRLAPEHKFPEGFHDCYDVVRELYSNPETYGVRKDCIGVSGDSAGGNLAAVCSVRDRNEHTGMIRFSALLYPTVDMGKFRTDRYEWSRDFYTVCEPEDFIWDAVMEVGGDGSMKTLVDWYLGGDASLMKQEYVSPFMIESAAGLPPTLIITAEYDYLTVEAEAYGAYLKEAGTDVKIIRYSGVDHAFIDKTGLYPQAEDAMKEIGIWMREHIPC